MISVTEVYKNLKDFCNKDQKGFITPNVFNSFAGLAQQEVFNSIFAALPQALSARRKSIDPGRDKSTYKQLEEDLAYFLDRAEIRASGVSMDYFSLSPKTYLRLYPLAWMTIKELLWKFYTAPKRRIGY